MSDNRPGSPQWAEIRDIIALVFAVLQGLVQFRKWYYTRKRRRRHQRPAPKPATKGD